VYRAPGWFPPQYKLDEEADKKASKKVPAKPAAKATPPKSKAAAQVCCPLQRSIHHSMLQLF
jgi:hypothetical protein